VPPQRRKRPFGSRDTAPIDEGRGSPDAMAGPTAPTSLLQPRRTLGTVLRTGEQARTSSMSALGLCWILC